jgi:hypothetical protein
MFYHKIQRNFIRHQEWNHLFLLAIILSIFTLMPSVHAQKAILLDSDTDYIDFGESSDLNVSAITIEAWIRRSEMTPGVILSKPGAYYLRINDSHRLDAGIYDDGTDEDWHTITGTTQLDINEYYHVVFSYSGSTLRLYLDGKQEASVNYSGAIDPFLTNPVYGGGPYFFDDFSDYTYAGQDVKMYGHENYGGAGQDVDVANNRYHMYGANTSGNVQDEAITFIKSFSSLDHIVQVDVLWAQQEGNAYITQRFTDVADKYEVAVDPEFNAFVFNKVVNDVWSQMASVDLSSLQPFNNNTWYNLKSKITSLGSTNNVKGWVDDILYIDEDDPDLWYDGLGLIVHDHDYENFSYDVYFDNFKVDIPFRGRIDELRIYNTAISQSNIITWMCKLVDNNHVNWSNLKGYWRFDDASDPTTDNSAGSNSGNLVGASFVDSPVPTGYYNSSASGNVDLSSTSNVFVDLSWDGNLPGASAIFNILQIHDSPNVLTNLYKYHAPFYWNISIDNDDGSFNADLQFHYDEIPGISDESTLALFYRASTGQAWTEVADYSLVDGGVLNDGIGYILANNQSAFGQYIISSNSDDNSLPVQLTQFSASTDGKQVRLYWCTESEIENLGFEIERRQPDQAEWQRIGYVAGQGNSSSHTDYHFIDSDIIHEGNHQYRLRQIDISGSFAYSDISTIMVQLTRRFSLEQNYPNPYNPDTIIEFTLPIESRVDLNVFSTTGEIVARLIDEIRPAGTYRFHFNAGGLPAGLYMYRMTSYPTGSGKSTTLSKKMILLK